MAKTRSQGPVLSQRERRKDSQDLRLKVGQEEFEEEDEKKPALEPFPQEKFIMWASKMFQDHFTAGKFIQLSILAFAVNQAYVAFDGTYTTESDTNLLISSLCGLVALIAGVVIAFRVKANLRKQRGEEIPVSLPPWNTVYLIFLPIMLPYVFQRELMLYNAAFASSVLELPLVAKVIIQTTIIGSNTEHDDLIVNVKVVLTHTAINWVLGKVSEFKSLDRVEVTLFSTLLTDLYLIESEELYIVLLQKLFSSYCFGLGVVYGITKLWTSNTLLRSLIVLIAWTASFTMMSLYQLEPILNENAIVWLYDYILSSETRIQIFSVWLVSLLLLIPTIFNYKIKLSTNSRRKIWHFLVFILIAYPFRLDPDFVKLSLSGSLILFFVVEMIRYLKLAPFGQVLDSHLREFADWRDEKGPIIISYIYLFIGITLPILFNNSVTGLVVLGVGDSLASIVGSKWGEIKWSRSEKTVEGTMTFVVSTFAVCSLLKWISWYFVDKSYHSLLLTCTLSGLLEGNSDMNDNIMIPGYMLVLLQSLE